MFRSRSCYGLLQQVHSPVFNLSTSLRLVPLTISSPAQSEAEVRKNRYKLAKDQTDGPKKEYSRLAPKVDRAHTLQPA